MDMSRKLAIAVVMLCLSATSSVFAIGLGDIEMQSMLNEPLNAVIELTSASKQELDELKVTIAPRESFQKMGIPRTTILDDFKFSVEQPQRGLPVIRVTTRKPVREPFLDFLVEASWSKGHLLRQYTLLVDPPVTMQAAPPVQRVPVRQTPSPSPAVKQTPSPAPVPVAAPVTPTHITAAPGDVDKYGPVKRNETLWDIARRVRPDRDISMQQMMIALLRANPEAFAANNINNLKAGATLQIPGRDDILALDKSTASREANRQYAEWQQGRGSGQAKAATTTEPATDQQQQATSGPAPAAEVTQEARLQLVAPDEEAIKGAVVPGMPEGGTATQAPESKELLKQLSLVTDEAEAGRAQSQELQSRVGKLEEQVADMQRLIELKDTQLANLQNRLAAQNQTASNTTSDASPEAGAPATDRSKTQVEGTPEANAGRDSKPEGIIDRLMENPVLAGLGVLVAMILGGFLWSSTRHRKQEDIFRDEPTLASQMSAARNDESPATPRIAVSDTSMLSDVSPSDMSPLQGDETSDPLTEADVFIAYGRVQQAEDVIKSALQGSPDNRDLKMKLIEIYHAAGNTAAFDTHAATFRETVDEDDPDWQRVARMGHELSPANPLYQGGISLQPVRDGEVDFDMDLDGLEENGAAGNEPVNASGDDDIGLDYDTGANPIGNTAENIDFNLDELNLDQEEEDLSEGLLQESDEIGTKLDLARAYMDMGDPDGARGILEEVIEEGNDEQKTEAENLISQIA
jgi:pilus assembly protein FimV